MELALDDTEDETEKELKKKKGMFGVSYYTIILISIFVGQIFCCFGMVAWVGKQVQASNEELVEEQAQYYQMLLNFWKELESDREMKARLQNADIAAPQSQDKNKKAAKGKKK